MPRFRFAAALCLAATAAAAQEAPEPEAPPAEAAKPSVRDAVDAGNYLFRRAFEERDHRAIGDLYTADARVIAPGAEPAVGREAIVAFWKGAMEGTKSVRLETLLVESEGDFAFEDGVAHLTAHDDSVSDARYLVVWKRVGRRWHMHRDLWNGGPAAAPPAPEPPAAEPEPESEPEAEPGATP
jgi:ketosteroid isomerase-like protein